MDRTEESPKVTFEDESPRRPAQAFRGFSVPASRPKGMAGWVIRRSGGSIETEAQANFVLIGFVAIAFAIIFIISFGGRSQPKLFPDDPRQMGQTPASRPADNS